MQFYYNGPNVLQDPKNGRMHYVPHGKYSSNVHFGSIRLACIEVGEIVSSIVDVAYGNLPEEMLEVIRPYKFRYRAYAVEETKKTHIKFGPGEHRAAHSLYIAVDEIVRHATKKKYTLADATIDFVTPFVIDMICGDLVHPAINQDSKNDLQFEVFDKFGWLMSKMAIDCANYMKKNGIDVPTPEAMQSLSFT